MQEQGDHVPGWTKCVYRQGIYSFLLLDPRPRCHKLVDMSVTVQGRSTVDPQAVSPAKILYDAPMPRRCR